MAPSDINAAHYAKGVMNFMDHISKQTSSRYDKKIARSSQFKSFLLYLSERAPSAMNGPLRSASRKCKHALRVQQKTQLARKRVAPPSHNQGDAKRHKMGPKIICDTREETIQQPQKDNMKECPKGNEISNPSRDLGCSKVALPGTSNFDKDRESPEKYSQYRDLRAEPAEGKLPSMAMTSTCGRLDGTTNILPTMYQMEAGLCNGSSDIEAFVKALLRNLKRSTILTNFNIDNEIGKIWTLVLLLNFFQVKPELYKHLESREQVPGHQLQTLIDWNTTDVGEILDALTNVKRSTIDNKIHRAYGQTMLVSSVDAQIAKGYKSTVSGQRSDVVAIMKELAWKKAGPVSRTELDQIISSYIYEYHAGQKWLAVMDWFGGSGIVLVFVIAGKS